MLMNFGKYRDQTCEWVLQRDPIYVQWLLGTESLNPYFIAAQKEFRRLKGGEAPPKQDNKTKLPWWDVLEVSPTDQMDAVKRAYRKQVSLYHPDKVAQLGVELKDLATKKTQAINNAYEEAMRLKGN